jgi:alpha-L-rhamnosidase
MRRLLALFTLGVSALMAAPTGLRCDYLENPLGIDSPAPSLSWRSGSTQPNWRQSAYQILVASSPALLRAGKPDVWDSGRRASPESVGISYGGPPLESGRRYHWTVRVWDAQGAVSEAAVPGWWEMGLLSPSDWRGQWITREDPTAAQERAAIRWIWLPGQDPVATPPGTQALFRLVVNAPEKPRNAALYVLSRARSRVRVNGYDTGGKDGRFQAFDRHDVTELLIAGKNLIQIQVTTAEAPRPGGGAGAPPGPGPGTSRPPQPPRPVAIAGLLRITRLDGTVETYPTGERWQARLASDYGWSPAAVVAPLDDPRMGPGSGPLPGPASLFRHEFALAKTVRSARLYVTALGSYRAFLNGRRVGADVLTPEYTEYAKRVTYQTYDVTDMLTPGANVLAAALGDGWFGSAMSWTGVRFSFLPPPARLLAQLRVEYSDGSADTISTGSHWKTSPAPILHSEIYAGEVYDARLEQAGWDRPGFRDDAWAAAAPAEAPPSRLAGLAALPPRVVETLTPKSVKLASSGTYIVDMGQNMVGWLRLRVRGQPGVKLRLRFAEILNPDGSIYVDNLRNANQTDVYYLRGGIEETWAPMFTFHGFRYVEITGYPGRPFAGSILGEVVTSAHTVTGRLNTSSNLVNQMWNAGIWGQRGNFLSVPTDCPQRDERLGWTGDAQVFWRTGAYNADIAAFGRKWMRDVADGQSAEGAFGNTAPAMPGGGFGSSFGAPGWGDAGVIVPWTAWQQYADLGIVREHWGAMERWMKFIEEANPDHLRRNKTGANFADWLPAGSQTPRDLVATAYWAMIARMMSSMATALDQPAEAARYAATYSAIRAAFQKEFIKDNGEIGSGSQTSYVLALHMDLVPPHLKAKAVENLIQDIASRDYHLTTGFLGTPHLLFVLSDNGHTDVAYRLLLKQTYPSWGYMLAKGATTWWERWNSDTGDPAMNSFNHYAFGSVMAWVYRYVAGIDTDPAAPGFRNIVIRPRVDPLLTYGGGEYNSVYGRIVTQWSAPANGAFSLRVTIPANTTAKVHLPDGRIEEAGSGVHEFRVP